MFIRKCEILAPTMMVKPRFFGEKYHLTLYKNATDEYFGDIENRTTDSLISALAILEDMKRNYPEPFIATLQNKNGELWNFVTKRFHDQMAPRTILEWPRDKYLVDP